MSSFHDVRPTLSHSWRSSSPLAEQALARDIAECSDDDVLDTAVDDVDDSEYDGGSTMYRRASGVTYGGSRPVFNPQALDETGLTPLERKQSRNAERSLLRDNHVLPPKHPQKKRQTLASRLYRHLFSTKIASRDEESPAFVVQRPTESSPLLGHANGYDHLEETWEQAVASGRLRTTWQRETQTIVAYSTPLIITFLLQYSINVASIFAVGRIGKMELGAVSCKSPPPLKTSRPAPLCAMSHQTSTVWLTL